MHASGVKDTLNATAEPICLSLVASVNISLPAQQLIDIQLAAAPQLRSFFPNLTKRHQDEVKELACQSQDSRPFLGLRLRRMQDRPSKLFVSDGPALLSYIEDDFLDALTDERSCRGG